MNSRMDKEHGNQFALLNERTKNGGASLIEFASIRNTTLASFAAIESLKQGRWVDVEE